VSIHEPGWHLTTRDPDAPCCRLACRTTPAFRRLSLTAGDHVLTTHLGPDPGSNPIATRFVNTAIQHPREITIRSPSTRTTARIVLLLPSHVSVEPPSLRSSTYTLADHALAFPSVILCISEWLWMSDKPGLTTKPLASITRLGMHSPQLPIRLFFHLGLPTSARTASFPVPSIVRPPWITTS